jgi:UDP-N-acetylmuramyl pentapeptide synthase
MLARAVQPGDAILIKGSLGSRMKLVVNALEHHAEAA